MGRTDERWRELKAALFDCGREYIEEFIGYEYPAYEDPGVTEARMDITFEEDMDDETFDDFYRRFVVEQCP